MLEQETLSKSERSSSHDSGSEGAIKKIELHTETFNVTERRLLYGVFNRKGLEHSSE